MALNLVCEQTQTDHPAETCKPSATSTTSKTAAMRGHYGKVAETECFAAFGSAQTETATRHVSRNSSIPTVPPPLLILDQKIAPPSHSSAAFLNFTRTG